ncbi:amino acid permease-like protein [Paraburkholderia sp. BL21I4N1]|nr:hypothetical protein [Paraburkholderia sp. BL21I4N1]PQV44449.1 amino acid permease-like protein [Paraburkholderia sp. BL21I4N1]
MSQNIRADNETLRARQVQMITIDGAIESGSFMGASACLAAAGPSLFFVYAVCGFFAWLIIRASGELVMYRPTTASFVSYARKFYGVGIAITRTAVLLIGSWATIILCHIKLRNGREPGWSIGLNSDGIRPVQRLRDACVLRFHSHADRVRLSGQGHTLSHPFPSTVRRWSLAGTWYASASRPLQTAN